MEAKLAGRIISAYACGFKCFASCPENAKVCGDQCSNSVPQLNVTGTSDKYFGKVEHFGGQWVASSKQLRCADHRDGVPLCGTSAQDQLMEFARMLRSLKGSRHRPVALALPAPPCQVWRLHE